MCQENPSWGAPRIHGELLKLGIAVGETSVSKYMVRGRKPPSQTWRTFLENHVSQPVSVDFFTVPTIRFQVLYVFLILAHDRRRIVHCNVTRHPTAEWTGQQLREALPFDQLPRYLLRDRDAIFGQTFRDQARDLDIEEVLSAPRSPWQRAYVERVIGSIRRECLDHVIVFDERALRRILVSYFHYYPRSRTHLRLPRSLKKAVEKQSEEAVRNSSANRNGTSINQFVAAAVAEKLSALQVAEFFADRKARADFKAFDKIMKRRRGKPPRTGDEMPR